jgi:hypothetical protein
MATRTVITSSPANGSIGQGAGSDTRAAVHARAAAAPTAPASAVGRHPPAVAASAPAYDGAAPALILRLNRLARETASLSERIEELEGELEQRTRRLQQLIGERDELRLLLAGRDGEVQRLNRELGALAAGAAPARRDPPAPFAVARGLLDRVRHVRDSPRGAKSAPPRPHQVNGGIDETRLVPWIKDRPPKDVVAVVVFGLADAEIQRVLDGVERYCTEHQTAPLLLTDNDSFQLFRNRRVLFEFLPPRAEQQRFAPQLDWQLFTLRRLALIRRKWRPVRVVPFGRLAAELVQLWRESPFEETPLPASLGSQPGLAFSAAQQSAAQR